MSLINQLKRFASDESALETIEWAVVAGLLTTIGAAVFFALGGDIARGVGAIGAVTNAIP